MAYAKEKALDGGCVLTCVGSLRKVTLRLANCDKTNRNEVVTLHERFEIVSLTGTVSTHGAHLHMSIADFEGNVVGGHLMDGCEVFTTAEVVLGECGRYVFTREMDDETGFDELVVKEKETATPPPPKATPPEVQHARLQESGSDGRGAGLMATQAGNSWFKRKDGRSWLAPPRPENAGKGFDEYVDDAVNALGQHKDWRAAGANRRAKGDLLKQNHDLPPAKESLAKVKKEDWRAAAAKRKRKSAEAEAVAASHGTERRGFFGWLGGIIAPCPSVPSSPEVGDGDGSGTKEAEVKASDVDAGGAEKAASHEAERGNNTSVEKE